MSFETKVISSLVSANHYLPHFKRRHNLQRIAGRARNYGGRGLMVEEAVSEGGELLRGNPQPSAINN